VKALARFPDSGRVVPEIRREDIREIIVSPYRVLAGGPGADQRDVTAVDGQASPMPAVSRTAACSR